MFFFFANNIYLLDPRTEMLEPVLRQSFASHGLEYGMEFQKRCVLVSMYFRKKDNLVCIIGPIKNFFQKISFLWVPCFTSAKPEFQKIAQLLRYSTWTYRCPSQEDNFSVQNRTATFCYAIFLIAHLKRCNFRIVKIHFFSLTLVNI